MEVSWENVQHEQRAKTQKWKITGPQGMAGIFALSHMEMEKRSWKRKSWLSESLQCPIPCFPAAERLLEFLTQMATYIFSFQPFIEVMRLPTLCPAACLLFWRTVAQRRSNPYKMSCYHQTIKLSSSKCQLRSSRSPILSLSKLRNCSLGREM